jgi:hypothetical protein
MRAQSITVPTARLLSLNGGAIDRPKNVPDGLQNRSRDRALCRFSFLTLRDAVASQNLHSPIQANFETTTWFTSAVETVPLSSDAALPARAFPGEI